MGYCEERKMRVVRKTHVVDFIEGHSRASSLVEDLARVPQDAVLIEVGDNDADYRRHVWLRFVEEQEEEDGHCSVSF